MPDIEAQEGLGSGDEQPPSKSARKRQMLALQKLGESLLELNDKQLAAIPIEDAQLLTALQECRRIRSHSARKRHLQLIGKLMRGVDPEPIQSALDRLHQQQRSTDETFHQLERLRDDILARGVSGIELALARFPGADRQQLRQLVLQHERERKLQKPAAAGRKLFRYLRELSDDQGA